MNGELKLMKMPSCSKKKLIDGIIKEFRSKNLTSCDKVLLYKSRFRHFAGKLLSEWEGPYGIEEVYWSGAIKINNAEGNKPRVVNGQRLKHYIAGNPINVDLDVIQVITPEEYIEETFRKTPEP